MGLMWPTAALLMLLGLVPVAFYLFRQRPRVRPVPTLLFWRFGEKTQRRSRWWSELRRWLSLLLQVAFVILLCLALGRPHLPSWGREPGSYILVLDTSPSMGAADREGVTAWEKALDEIDRRVGRLRPDEQVGIVLAAPEPEVIQGWTGNPRRARHALTRARPGPRPADWTATLELAHNLREGRDPSGIIVFSDYVWEGRPVESLLADGTHLSFHSAVENAGITRFTARRSPAVPGDYLLQATVAHRGKSPLEAEALLYRDDVLIDVREVRIEPGGDWDHLWRNASFDGHDYRLVLESDSPIALDADNEAALAVPELPSLSVVLRGDPDPFLEYAFRVQPRIDIRRDPLPDSDPALSANGDRPTLHVYHRTHPAEDFEDAPALLVDPAGDGFWGVADGTVESPLVADQDREHRLLAHVDLGQLRLSRATRFTPPELSDVILAAADAPLMFGRWDERANWLVLPFPLDQSDLVLRAAFPIMAANLIQSLRPSPEFSSATLPGRTQTLLEPIDLAESVSTAAAPRAPSRWERYPLWWWVVLTALLWLFVEGWTFSRRKTE